MQANHPLDGSIPVPSGSVQFNGLTRPINNCLVDRADSDQGCDDGGADASPGADTAGVAANG